MTAEATAARLTASYDREADALYVYLQATIEPDEVTSTVPVRLHGDGPDLLLELDAGGRLVGIEVLHAARTLPIELLSRVHVLTPDPTPPPERHS